MLCKQTCYMTHQRIIHMPLYISVHMLSATTMFSRSSMICVFYTHAIVHSCMLGSKLVT